MICRICGKNYSPRSLSYHISQSHKISKQEYYNTYLKIDGEGLCKYCGKPSNFISIVHGYSTFCCHYCCNRYMFDNETEEHKKTRIQKSVASYKKYRKNMTLEEQEKDHMSHVNAQRNRSEEAKVQTSKKLKERCVNRTQEEKIKMYDKMVATRKNWSDEKKKEYSLKQSKATKSRWNNTTDEDKQLFKETCKKSYWSSTVNRIDEINNKRQKSRINYMKNKPSYNGIFFDSNWELNVYKYCLTHNIPIERNTSAIKYKHNGKIKSTYPDFYIDGIIVEIKGKQFVNPNGTWINPYMKVDDGCNEAKHQALLENGVVIWYEKQVKEFLNGNMEVLYGKRT